MKVVKVQNAAMGYKTPIYNERLFWYTSAYKIHYPESVMSFEKTTRFFKPQTTLPMSSIPAAKFKSATLNDILLDGIQDLYSAESSQAKALEKMAAAAFHEPLRKLFEKHFELAESHVRRIEQIAERLGISPEGKSCNGMMGIILDLEVMLRSQTSGVRDIQLVCYAQKMNHYKLVGYSSTSAVAKLLKHAEAAKLLQVALAEETNLKVELASLGGSPHIEFSLESKPVLETLKAI